MRLGIEVGEHTLDVAVQHGIQGVPIYINQLIDDGVEQTLKPLQDKGVAVCQIGAFGFNPLSTDVDAQNKQRQMLEQVIPMANDTGCRYIVINGGNYHPSGFLAGDARNFNNKALDLVAQELEPFINLAEKHNVVISIEPYLKTAIHSAERFLQLKQRLDSDALRINIDVTSLYNYQDMWDASAKIETTCNSLAGHYGLGHIKDVELKEAFHIHVDLAPLGSSGTDWSNVLALMSPHLPDDSWLILEHVSTPEEAEQSLALLRQSAEQAGVTLE